MIIDRHGGSIALAAALALAVGWPATGCHEVAEPGPIIPVVISFTPAARSQQLTVGGSLDFAVRAEPATELAVTWRLGRSVVGTAMDYVYQGARVGRDTLRAWAVQGTTATDWFWIIDVVPIPTTAPPAVPHLRAFAGPEPVEVLLTWDRIASSTWPMADYVVKASRAGTITEQAWDALPVLATVPHQAALTDYQAVFGAADGLQAGARTWFAIRGRDDHGQLSATIANVATTVTRPWWIEGRVADDLGRLLPGVPIGSSTPPVAGTTDGAGWYRVGPYRSIDAVSVRTAIDGYFNFSSGALSDSFDVRLDIVLPSRYTIDAGCLSYHESFMDYVRAMTHTTPVTDDPAASRLWKWPSYPVRVFLPDSTLAGGRRLDDLARPMLAIWNDAIGEPMFTEAPSAAEADVHFRWVSNAAAGYGQVTLESPAGGILGEVAPQRMRVDVETGILSDQFFQEVSLHELGHVLGLVGHYDPSCQVAGHLMVFGASGNLSLAEPVHVDEARALRFVVRAPQGVDMAGYER